MGESMPVNPQRLINTFRYSLIVQSIGLFVSLCCAGFIVFAHYLAVSSWGTSGLLFLVVFILPVILASIPGAIVFLVMFIFNRRRKLSANVMVACVYFFVVSFWAIRAGERIRHNGFESLAVRSQPLVQAIHDYQADHERPPSSLGDLVPAYLAKVPGTGMGAYPFYEYEVPGLVDNPYYEGQEWVLSVFTPSTGLNFDLFIYFPDQNYPEYGYGGRLEIIGDWAYVHE